MIQAHEMTTDKQNKVAFQNHRAILRYDLGNEALKQRDFATASQHYNIGFKACVDEETRVLGRESIARCALEEGMAIH